MLPSLDRIAYFLGSMGLCDGDELNVARSASNLRRRPRDLLAHPLEILSDRIHCRGVRRGDAYYFSSSVVGTSTATTTEFIVLASCSSIFVAEIPSPKVPQW